MKNYNVMAMYYGKLLVHGVVVQSEHGWKFSPVYQAYPSRKWWPTPEDALRGRVKDYTLVEQEAAA